MEMVTNNIGGLKSMDTVEKDKNEVRTHQLTTWAKTMAAGSLVAAVVGVWPALLLATSVFSIGQLYKIFPEKMSKAETLAKSVASKMMVPQEEDDDIPMGSEDNSAEGQPTTEIN